MIKTEARKISLKWAMIEATQGIGDAAKEMIMIERDPNHKWTVEERMELVEKLKVVSERSKFILKNLE